MMPIEVVYNDVMKNPKEYWAWATEMGKDFVRTAVITYLHLGAFVLALNYIFG